MSCAGCGMCEQTCPHHLPLSAIFHHIKAQLVEPDNPTPDRHVEEPLPLM
jgi:Na+-translocating ferredoxin:NAD+ oxidoreductase RnfC subunit